MTENPAERTPPKPVERRDQFLMIMYGKMWDCKAPGLRKYLPARRGRRDDDARLSGGRRAAQRRQSGLH